MPSRLFLALALSLALHGVLLLPDMLKCFSVAPPRPVLQASLRLPPHPDPAPEPLLKNTLDNEEKPKVKTPPPPAAPPKPGPKPGPVKKVTQREMQAVQKKLAKYVFYPEDARRKGIEGVVYLHLDLSKDGSVEDVRIVASSGYLILDKAAEKGVWAAQKIPGAKSGEYPYIFQLIP